MFSSSASQIRNTFIESHHFHGGATHQIRRSELLDDVVTLYRKNQPKIYQEYPFHIKFVAEKAIDAGGVSRDMFSAFFEEMYKAYFDSANLLSPIVHPGMDVEVMSILGAIISHAYIATGILPIRIAFPTLACCLLGANTEISSEVLIQTFIDSLSLYDASVIKRACAEARAKQPVFSSDLMSLVLSVFSRYGVRQLPTPPQLQQTLSQVAAFEFISKPSAAISLLYSGVPDQHRPFWQELHADDFLTIYGAQTVSVETVLTMLENAVGTNANEERISCYLRQYIGSMNSDTLRSFLRFVTGSTVCSSPSIEVTFNGLAGSARRPIAHTCTPSLELSWTYKTYFEFVDELDKCLSNPYTWFMDAF